MNTLNRHYNTFKDDLAQSLCTDQLGDAIEKFCVAVGLDAMAYLVTARPRYPDGTVPDAAFFMTRPAKQFTKWEHIALRSRAGQVGILHRACEKSTLPIVWNFVDSENRMEGIDVALTAVQSALYHRCMEMTGIHAGITVPLHMSDGRFGFLSWLTSEPERLMRELVPQSDLFLAAAHRFNAAMRECSDHQIVANQRLSSRETECLRLIAEGRSLDETATVVGICYGTVRFHLRSAAEKLGTPSRAHTIAKASYLGLLGTFH